MNIKEKIVQEEDSCFFNGSWKHHLLVFPDFSLLKRYANGLVLPGSFLCLQTVQSSCLGHEVPSVKVLSQAVVENWRKMLL